MSILTNISNYGGKIADYQQNIKQFYVSSPSLVNWIYKKLSNNLTVITPSDTKKTVLINNDLIVTGSLYNTSDERIKENISIIDDKELDYLFTLNPIHYSFKNDINKKGHYGILAQNIEKVYPELVQENYNGYKTVNYQELIPIMLAKMKNMQFEIEQLQLYITKINFN
jgi:hypothetical protein